MQSAASLLLCVCFPPSWRGASCDSFYCHTALGALTASQGPSERPNVNLMTWRWANDKQQGEGDNLSLHLYDFLPVSPPQVLFSEHPWHHCAALAAAVSLNNLHAFCIMQKKLPGSVQKWHKAHFAVAAGTSFTSLMLLCTSPCSRNNTMYITELIMQTVLRGREEIILLVDSKLSERSQRKSFQGRSGRNVAGGRFLSFNNYFHLADTETGTNCLHTSGWFGLTMSALANKLTTV